MTQLLKEIQNLQTMQKGTSMVTLIVPQGNNI